MKIFASWSGEDSRKAAELLRSWLPLVIQEVEVWVSSRDIEKGDKWTLNIWNSLSDHDIGILLVTPTNFIKPWILFEAGALSKSVKSKVIPILCKIDRFSLGDTPISQLQNSLVTYDDFWMNVVSINSSCSKPLAEPRLRQIFDKWWPDFEDEFNKIEFAQPKAGEKEEQSADTRLERIENNISAMLNALKRMDVEKSMHWSKQIDRSNEINVSRIVKELLNTGNDSEVKRQMNKILLDSFASKDKFNVRNGLESLMPRDEPE